ncbi:MAG: response regulator [Candidatus Nitrosocosmicus sp.]
MQVPTSIVIIDDEANLSLPLKQFFFVKMGFDAVSITKPRLAFDYLKYNHSKYALIITDFAMPEISGLQLAIKLREEINSKIKIILVTAFSYFYNHYFVFTQWKFILGKSYKSNIYGIYRNSISI